MILNVLAVGDVVGDSGVEYLSRHLRGLKKLKGVHFTVVNGENASGVGILPRQAREIFDAGADVVTLGSHTWNHVRLQGVSRETLQREVGRTEETLEALLGGGPYWLRPPYGAVDAADRELLQVPMIKWSIAPRDWEKLNTPQVKAAVLENAAPNQIILLHDIYDTSVDAALEIVDTLQGEGYRFVTVQELLEANGIQPEAGVLYCSGDI